MPTLIKQFTFVADTNIAPNQVNANFDDIVAFINNDVIHKDGTRAMTAHLSLVGSDPTTDNQAARKAYVDAKAASVDAHPEAAAAQTAANNAQGSANTALDRVPNKIRWGQATVNTNGAGDFQFAHGLGVTPAAVVVLPHFSSSNFGWRAAIENWNSTHVNLRIYNTTTGAAAGAGVAFNISYFAGA